MNKKLIAGLLSACLVVASAVPAFAISSQSGLDEDITVLSFQKDSYTVKQGEEINLYNEVMAFAGNKQLIQEPNLQWSYQNDNNFAFNLDDTSGIAEAIESKGTAVVTVTTADGTIKATTKLVASGAAKDQDATGFTFAKSASTLLTGDQALAGNGDEIVIVPTPTGSKFTKSQIDLLTSTAASITIEFAAPAAAITVQGIGNADMDKITFTVDNATLKGITATQKAVSVKYEIKDFPASYANGTIKNVNIARTVRVDAKLARQADAVYGLGNKTIEVGQKVKAADLFKQGPSAHNIKLDVVYGTDFVDQNATVLDYADVNLEQVSSAVMTRANMETEAYVQGIAVGKNKITANLENGKTASVIVEVVARGTLPNTSDVKISNTAATLKINEPLKLTVSNVPAGKEVTWKVVENTVAQISVFKGVSTTVYPKMVGTATVSAMIDGVVVATSVITVTNQTLTNQPNKPGSTNNPQTSDMLLSNLF